MIYEYRCRACGAQFEVEATIAEKEAGLHPLCPQCGSALTIRRFSGIGILRGQDAGRAAARGFPRGSGCCSPRRE